MQLNAVGGATTFTTATKEVRDVKKKQKKRGVIPTFHRFERLRLIWGGPDHSGRSGFVRNLRDERELVGLSSDHQPGSLIKRSYLQTYTADR